MLLVAEEAAETELNLLGWAGERGEQKGFDSEFDAIECGACACVGDGGPEAARGGFESLRDVDAARDDLAYGRFDVQRGNGFLRADAVALDDIALQREAAASRRPANATLPAAMH